MSDQNQWTMTAIHAIQKNPENPRTITGEKFEKLVKSIQEFPEMLQARPIVVGQDGVVLGGNMRLAAAIEAGLTEVPVKTVDWTEQQRQEFVIKDNLSYGEWDFDMIANGWDHEQLLDWGMEVPTLETEEDGETDPNEVPDIPDEAITKRGDVWILGNHKLMCGDTLDPLDWNKLMEEDLADMILTDPPYNVDYEGSDGQKIKNDKMSEASFETFLTESFERINDYTRKGGAWYVWHADSAGHIFRKALRDAGVLLKQNLIWVKNSMTLGRQDYQWQHEPCLYGWKPGAGHYFTEDRSNTTVLQLGATWEDRWKKIESYTKQQLLTMIIELLELPRTVIHHDKPKKNDLHPTMKPVEMLVDMVYNSTQMGDLIVDGFVGSGSTIIAAQKTGRKCYGMELDPKYVDVAVKRWEDFTGKKAELKQ